ncbi:PREDICTED: uncharacterized protein LOC104603610 [Nelumbo nucifera]|uniref:Uncharacterized protein LOC104603610 n=1 Tax=Nelumbo nucifera TaxID=4432 RepID=A0A1U8Q6U6_NELNU|nr:PREDICTED: uncharacterized protein LOC104603610 [Nelumbo nucifera]
MNCSVHGDGLLIKSLDMQLVVWIRLVDQKFGTIENTLEVSNCFCNYYLHQKCLNVERSMEHPAHPKHPLTLLPMPTYPPGAFLCSACREDGSSFSLSCAHCEFDLHVQCASLPQTAVHEAHPLTHTLYLSLSITQTQRLVVPLC